MHRYKSSEGFSYPVVLIQQVVTPRRTGCALEPCLFAFWVMPSLKAILKIEQ